MDIEVSDVKWMKQFIRYMNAYIKHLMEESIKNNSIVCKKQLKKDTKLIFCFVSFLHIFTPDKIPYTIPQICEALLLS